MSKNDFILHLQCELERKKNNNPHYSLRAFARDLGIEASLLSKILRGKAPLTSRMFERLAPILGVREEDYKNFESQIKFNELVFDWQRNMLETNDFKFLLTEKAIQKKIVLSIDSIYADEAKNYILGFTYGLINYLEERSEQKNCNYEFSIAFAPISED